MPENSSSSDKVRTEIDRLLQKKSIRARRISKENYKLMSALVTAEENEDFRYHSMNWHRKNTKSTYKNP